MNNIDDMIGRALSDEDRALLQRHGDAGYIAEAFGIFRGPAAWAMWVAYATSVLAFVAAGYAMWRVATTPDVLDAVRWGVGAVVLFQLSVMTKGFMGARMEANRMLRELKRVELQLALLREQPSA